MKQLYVTAGLMLGVALLAQFGIIDAGDAMWAGLALAVANTKSTIVTNGDADPRTMNDSRLYRAPVKACKGTVEVAAADDNDSVYRMLRMHTSDVPLHFWVTNDAITAGTQYNLGAYDTADNGGAIIGSGNEIATLVDMSSARTAPTDLLHEANDIDNAEQALWQILGLSADPQKWVDIAFTAPTVGTAAGTISLTGEFAGYH